MLKSSLENLTVIVIGTGSIGGRLKLKSILGVKAGIDPVQVVSLNEIKLTREKDNVRGVI